MQRPTLVRLYEQLRHIWLGDEKTWRVFWYYGVGIAGGVLLPVFLFVNFLLPARLTLIPYALIFMVIHTYAIWLLVSLWRGAYNLQWWLMGHVVRLLMMALAAWMLVSFYGIYSSPSKELASFDMLARFQAAEARKKLAKDYCIRTIREQSQKLGHNPDEYLKRRPELYYQCVDSYLKNMHMYEFVTPQGALHGASQDTSKMPAGNRPKESLENLQ